LLGSGKVVKQIVLKNTVSRNNPAVQELMQQALKTVKGPLDPTLAR
jgi:hypothetical protein